MNARHCQVNGTGSALVVGLWMLAILSLTSLGLAYHSRLALRTSTLSRRRQEALYLCKAMASRAMAEIVKDTNEYDALNEPWSAHRSFQEEGWMSDLDVDERVWGAMEYEVWDESGKININTMPESYVANLVLLEPAQASSILDWVDRDDAPRPGGAESEYYMRLTPPRQPRNAALSSLDELLAVKGITPEIYLGEPEEEGEAPTTRFDRGLRAALTVHGDSQLININTAPAEVLAAISPRLSEETVERIVERVRGADEVPGTSDDAPFTALDELVDVYGISDFEVALLRAACDVKSSIFSIYCRASTREGTVVKTIRTVVRREPDSGAVRTLAWFEY
jgi:general secretion pathway protein K